MPSCAVPPLESQSAVFDTLGLFRFIFQYMLRDNSFGPEVCLLKDLANYGWSQFLDRKMGEMKCITANGGGLEQSTNRSAAGVR